MDFDGEPVGLVTQRVFDLAEDPVVAQEHTRARHADLRVMLLAQHDRVVCVHGSVAARQQHLRAATARERSSDVCRQLIGQRFKPSPTASSNISASGWRLARFQANRVFHGQACAIVASVGDSADGKWIVTAERDWGIRLRSLANPDVAILIGQHVSEITSVSFTADGKQILTSSTDRTAKLESYRRIWNPRRGKSSITGTNPSKNRLTRRYGNAILRGSLTVGFLLR